MCRKGDAIRCHRTQEQTEGRSQAPTGSVVTCAEARHDGFRSYSSMASTGVGRWKPRVTTASQMTPNATHMVP